MARIIDDGAYNVRAKVIAIYVVLVSATIFAWTLALVAFATRPLLLGTALIAYSFGLRHAVDADHISAIDNVTRKLMQDGKRPVAVGFFFSLGHSTVVVGLTIAIAVGASVVKASMPGLQNAGGLIGTSVSALFLFAIATLNIVVFLGVYDAFRRVRRGGTYNEEAVNAYLAKRGLLGRPAACGSPFRRLLPWLRSAVWRSVGRRSDAFRSEPILEMGDVLAPEGVC